jgi:D-serine deaminase-like pyridoxal phosphate-dependent protein
LPEAVDLPGWTFAFGGDEHGKLLRDASHAAPAPAPALGSQLRLLPGHGDTTINLHDAYEIFEGGNREIRIFISITFELHHTTVSVNSV